MTRVHGGTFSIVACFKRSEVSLSVSRETFDGLLVDVFRVEYVEGDGLCKGLRIYHGVSNFECGLDGVSGWDVVCDFLKRAGRDTLKLAQ